MSEIVKLIYLLIVLIVFDADGILKENMVMLNFFPNLEGQKTKFSKAELVFVMDRSGTVESMLSPLI